MKSSPHTVALFFAIGLGSGLLGAIIANMSVAWVWVGMGAILVLGLSVSITIANRLRWLVLKLSLCRCLPAALIISAAYPISVLVTIMGQAAYESLYARMFPTEWQERVYSGSLHYTIFPLYLAAVVSAVLLSSALRVLTRKWEKQVILLLVIAGILTIPLSQTLAALIREPNWHLILFPVGNAFFGALSGYWLVRSGSTQDDLESLAPTASERRQI